MYKGDKFVDLVEEIGRTGPDELPFMCVAVVDTRLYMGERGDIWVQHNSVRYTPERARELARYLLRAANVAEDFQKG